MTKTSKSRVEGLIYLVTVLSGLFSLMYVPNHLISLNDISSTVDNLQGHKTLFALGVLSELLCYIAFLVLPIALFRHFETHNRSIALVMVYLVMVAVPISCIAVIHKTEILAILYENNIQMVDLEVIIQSELSSYYGTIKTAKVFWGLWLIPFGYLGHISNKVPKALCVLLILGGIGYQVNFTGAILFPGFKETIVPKIAKIPSTVGEIGTCLWLLIVGIAKTDSPSKDTR